MGERKRQTRNGRIAAASFPVGSFALVLLAGLIGGLGAVAAAGLFPGALFSQLPQAFLPVLWDAVETSVVEEVLFRGVLLWGLVSWYGRSHIRRAVVATALVFGVLHLAPFDAFQLAPVLVIQALLKVAQAALFGLLMGWLVVRSPWFSASGWQRARCLAVPIAIHFAFDLLYLGIPLLSGLPTPETYLTGSLSDTILLLITTLLLVAAFASYANSERSCK